MHDVLDDYTDRERIAAMAIVSGQADSYDLDALAVSDRLALPSPRIFSTTTAHGPG